jgi:transcriptional regulator with XRE-family HTH domain
VAKTAEHPQVDGRSPKDLGRQLRQVRRKQGLSRAEVARSAGLTRRELAAYERGRIVIPESDLWCLAGSCGVDVNELMPDRTPLRIGSGLSSLAMGDSIRRLREPGEPEGLLREYLSMVYELRNLPPGSRIPLRESDLALLADALGGTPDTIEDRLVELIGASREEAARLRAMILPPLSLPSGLPSSTDPYAAYGEPDAQSPVVDFFSAPRAQDPFSPQPSPESAGETIVTAPVDGSLNGNGNGNGTSGHEAPVPTEADPFAAASAPAAYTENGTNPFDPGTPFEPSASFEPANPFETAVNGDAEPDADPFAMPMPSLRPDPFGLPPTTPDLGADDGIEGFVVDVPEGPLASMSTSTPRLDPTNPNGVDAAALGAGSATDPPTDWVGIRDAAAVADTPPEVVLGDGWGAPPLGDAGSDDAVPEVFTLDPATPDCFTPEPVIGAPLTEDALAIDPIVLDPSSPDPSSPDRTNPEPVAVEDAPGDAVYDATPIVWRAEREPAPEIVPTELAVTLSASPFEHAGTGWQLGGLFPATAMADDGALALRRADTRWALSDLEADGDFTTEAILDFSAGAAFGVLFRASLDEHERVTGYSFDVDPISGGGGYLVRQWDDNRAHWRPIVHEPMTDPSRLYGRHVITLTVQGDRLGVFVDGENVLAVPALSRASIELGREPCRGSRLGIHAGATTELTVETFRAAQH